MAEFQLLANLNPNVIISHSIEYKQKQISDRDLSVVYL